MDEDTKRCPFCGEEILAVAIRCKHCKSDLAEQPNQHPDKARPAADLGVCLIGLPIIATVLAWLWIGSMSLWQGRESNLIGLAALTVLSTALIAAQEARWLGMVSDGKGEYGPVAWFLLVAVIWVIAYPSYLYRRRKYGLPNLLRQGIGVVLVFLGSVFFLNHTIEGRNAEERQRLERATASVQPTARPEKALTSRRKAPTPAKPTPSQRANVVKPGSGPQTRLGPTDNDIPSRGVKDLEAQAQQESQDNPADQIPAQVLQRMRQSLARRYPRDASMQEKALGAEVEAYGQIQRYSAGGVPAQILGEIRQAAADRYPDSYSMQKTAVDAEVEAYRQLDTYTENRVPPQVVEQIMERVAQRHPESFAAQKKTLDSEVEAFRQLLDYRDNRLPPSVLDDIRQTAARRYPDSYFMQKQVIDAEVERYLRGE